MLPPRYPRRAYQNYFSPQTDLPLTIGLLTETSKSQHAVLERGRRRA
jgi:hypothetical protein